MKVFAMIPARSGSKGVPNKNIAKVGGVPLIWHAQGFANELKVDKVIVSTDSERYADWARMKSISCSIHMRGPYASSDTAMEEDIIADYVEQGLEIPDVWVWLKPTSPFRRVVDVERGLRALEDDPTIDSVRLVTEADARLQTIGDLGWLSWYGEPNGPGSLGRSKMRRTEVPQVYKPFNLEIFRHRKWAACPKLFMGTRIHPIVCPKITGIDIDSSEDLSLVNLIVSASPRPDWLGTYIHA